MSIIIVRLPDNELRYIEFENFTDETLTTDAICRTLASKMNVKTPFKLYHRIMDENILLTSNRDIQAMFAMQRQLTLKFPMIVVKNGEASERTASEVEYDPTSPHICGLADRLSTPSKRKRTMNDPFLISLESEIESESEDIFSPRKKKRNAKQSILRNHNNNLYSSPTGLCLRTTMKMHSYSIFQASNLFDLIQ